MRNLAETLRKYAKHPDFLGTALTDPNQRGAVDDTPLHIAARKGDLEDVVVLVENGANINLKGDLGNTALHFAALAGMKEAVLKLLELGVDPTIRNEFGEAPLKVAQQGNQIDIARILGSRTTCR